MTPCRSSKREGWRIEVRGRLPPPRRRWRRRVDRRARGGQRLVVLARSRDRGRWRARRLAAGADLAARPAARSGTCRRTRCAGAQRHGVRQAPRRPACGAPARAHQGDHGDPRRAVRPGNLSTARQARRFRPAKWPASPRSKRRPGCAGSAASGCGHSPSGCRAFRGSTRSSRRPGCGPSCAPISATGSTGCSFCAPTSSAASSPTIWGSARPCRPSPTSWSRSARAASTGRAWSSARPASCRTGSPRRRGSRPSCACCRCTAPTARERFAEIGNADLVITTYALLPRDADQLLPVAWHMAVLDEAQAIKNANAKTTQLVCRLDARHRLCLTGTPMENHLGELWSQFAFLMPGLLGDAKRFAPGVPHPDREEAGRRTARRAVGAAEAVPAAADQEPGRGRAAAEDRDRAPARAGRAAARPLRDRAGGDAREGAPRDRRRRGSPAATSSCSTRC